MCWSNSKSKSLWVLNWNCNKLLAGGINFVFNQCLLFWNFSLSFWCGFFNLRFFVMVMLFVLVMVVSVFSLLFNFKKVFSFWNFSENRFWEFKETSKIFRNLFSDFVLSHNSQLIFTEVLIYSILN